MSFFRQLAALALLTTALVAVENVPTPAVAAPALDAEHALLAGVLARVVKVDGVDYGELRRDHVGLDRYRVQLATAVEPTERMARLALFINAYNALTLELVRSRLPEDATRWPAWSITSAGLGKDSAWKSWRFRVAGAWRTLDEIEHDVLRKLGDPRIHFALNCASRSCPALAARPYLVATLESQLEAAARDFATNAQHLRLEDGVLRVNPILDWFAADFVPGSTGAAHGAASMENSTASAASGTANTGSSVRTFLRARVPAGPVAQALAGDRPLQFFTYDWTLNLSLNLSQGKP